MPTIYQSSKGHAQLTVDSSDQREHFLKKIEETKEGKKGAVSKKTLPCKTRSRLDE